MVRSNPNSLKQASALTGVWLVSVTKYTPIVANAAQLRSILENVLALCALCV